MGWDAVGLKKGGDRMGRGLSFVSLFARGLWEVWGGKFNPSRDRRVWS